MWVPSVWETTVYFPFLVIVAHEHIGSIYLPKFDDSRKCVISNILSPAGERYKLESLEHPFPDNPCGHSIPPILLLQAPT